MGDGKVEVPYDAGAIAWNARVWGDGADGHQSDRHGCLNRARNKETAAALTAATNETM